MRRREGARGRRPSRRGGGGGRRHRPLGLPLDGARGLLCRHRLDLERQSLPALRARCGPAGPRSLRRRGQPRRGAHARGLVGARPRDAALVEPVPVSSSVVVVVGRRRLAPPSRRALPPPLEEAGLGEARAPPRDRGPRPEEREGRARADRDGGVAARADAERRRRLAPRVEVGPRADERRRGRAPAAAEGGPLGDRDPGDLPRVRVW